MPHCSALGCSNKGSVKSTMLSFFRFPLSIPEGKQWIQNCGRTDWQPSRYNRICSAHFEEACFEEDMFYEIMGQDPTKRRRRRTLKPGSVPTIFHHEHQPSKGRKAKPIETKPNSSKLNAKAKRCRRRPWTTKRAAQSNHEKV